jgi:hypothetical protein
MTIEIHRPELEALILERMRRGAFQNIEDVLMQALTSAPPPSPGQERLPASSKPIAATGAALVSAMQASPFKDIVLESARHRLPVREVVF